MPGVNEHLAENENRMFATEAVCCELPVLMDIPSSGRLLNIQFFIGFIRRSFVDLIGSADLLKRKNEELSVCIS